MKWNRFKKSFPYTGDNVVLLVSDGENIYAAYEDHKMIWFYSETRENEELLRSRLTHWARLDGIKFRNGKL